MKSYSAKIKTKHCLTAFVNGVLLTIFCCPMLQAGGVSIDDNGNPITNDETLSLNQAQQTQQADAQLGYTSIPGQIKCFSTAKYTMITGKSTCPSLCEIRKVPGTNNWETIQPNWKGGFVTPIQGQGTSDEVAQFVGAKWIKISNVQHGAGFIECEYLGNKKSAPQPPNCNTSMAKISSGNGCSGNETALKNAPAGADEIIRFTQSNNNAAYPTGMYWAQNSVSHIFPSVQKACAMSVKECTFRLDKE